MTKKMRIALDVCAVATSLAALDAPPSATQAPPGFVTPARPVVSDSAIVRPEYTVRDDTGTVRDASADGEPLVFTRGQHPIIAGQERAVAGMGVGEEQRVSVAAEDAYGPVVPDAPTEVPRTMIPADAQYAGQQLVARGPDGATCIVWVKDPQEATVVLGSARGRLQCGDGCRPRHEEIQASGRPHWLVMGLTSAGRSGHDRPFP